VIRKEDEEDSNSGDGDGTLTYLKENMARLRSDSRLATSTPPHPQNLSALNSKDSFDTAWETIASST
jgi:hypothetical protein